MKKFVELTSVNFDKTPVHIIINIDMLKLIVPEENIIYIVNGSNAVSSSFSLIELTEDSMEKLLCTIGAEGYGNEQCEK